MFCLSEPLLNRYNFNKHCKLHIIQLHKKNEDNLEFIIKKNLLLIKIIKTLKIT